MLSIKNLFQTFAVLMLVTLMFSSCTPELEDEVTPTKETTTTPRPIIDKTAFVNALTAVEAQGNDVDIWETGCYDAFANIDFAGTQEYIDQQVDEIIDNMTQEEFIYIMFPVCNDDGLYVSACIADYSGITDYELCEELEFEECDFDWEACFTIVYPMDIVLENGSSVTVNNNDELCSVLQTCDGVVDVAYPISVQIVADGSVQQIDNEDGIEALLDECEDGLIGDDTSKGIKKLKGTKKAQRNF